VPEPVGQPLLEAAKPVLDGAKPLLDALKEKTQAG
jgi:hypothetical protein